MLEKLKAEVCRANLNLVRKGLVIETWGNASGVDRERGLMVIKPSGVPYEELNWQDMVIVDFENKVVDGSFRPSSDTPTHAVLYKHFDCIGGIAHTHSAHAAAWAQACRAVPVYGTTHADHLACAIPCTGVMPDDRIAGDYEVETGRQILDVFQAQKLNPAEVQMVLVACHGPFTWGKSAAQAVYNSRILEELCRTALLTEQVNGAANPMKAALIQKHYERKHGKNAYYGQR